MTLSGYLLLCAFLQNNVSVLVYSERGSALVARYEGMLAIKKSLNDCIPKTHVKMYPEIVRGKSPRDTRACFTMRSETPEHDAPSTCEHNI